MGHPVPVPLAGPQAKRGLMEKRALIACTILVLGASLLVPLLGAGAQEDCPIIDQISGTCPTTTTQPPSTTEPPIVTIPTDTIPGATTESPPSSTEPGAGSGEEPSTTTSSTAPTSEPSSTTSQGQAGPGATPPGAQAAGQAQPVRPASAPPAAAPPLIEVIAPALPSLVRDVAESVDPALYRIDTIRTPSSSSATLAAVVEQIAILLGRRPLDVWLEIVTPFPVAGPVYYSDDFGDFRIGPPVHPHAGNDIFAGMGTPTVAPVDGRVEYENGGLGGLSWNLFTAEGTRVFCAHLSAIPSNVKSGDVVARGTVIGFVGDSGNAAGGAPHCHFEIRPRNGAPVNPKPFLDQWLAEARARANALFVSLGGVLSGPLLTGRRVSSLDRMVIDLAAVPGSSRAVGDSFLGRAARTGGLDLAGSTAALTQVDWNLPSGAFNPDEAAVVRSYDAAKAVMAGLTPPSLGPALGLPSAAMLRRSSFDISPA